MKKSTLALSLLLCTILQAGEVQKDIKQTLSTEDANALKFFSLTLHNLENHNPNVIFEDIRIKTKVDVPEAEGFTGYVMSFKAKVKDQFNMYNEQTLTDVFFVSDEGLIAKQLYSPEGENLSNRIVPKFNPEDYYTDDHYVAGDKNASMKIMMFSDPFCPRCREVFPTLLSKVKMEPSKYVLYLIDYPLATIHPGSEGLIQCMKQAKHKGIADVENRIYNDDAVLRYVDTLDPNEFASFFKAKFNLELDIEEFKNENLDTMLSDKKLGDDLGVNATPTIFINGIRKDLD